MVKNVKCLDGSLREVETEVQVGARPKRGHTARNRQAGVRSNLEAPRAVLFPLPQETPQMTCYRSLSPYWGVLGLGSARPGIRGQRSQPPAPLLRRADILAWGWGREWRRTHSQNIKAVEDRKPLEDRGGVRSYVVLPTPPHPASDTHPWTQHGAGHVGNVENRRMLTCLFFLAKRDGAAPRLGGGVRYLCCPCTSPLRNLREWRDFSEPVCLRRQDRCDLRRSWG